MNRIFKSYGYHNQCRSLFLFVTLNVLCVYAGFGQSFYKLNGTVRDSLNRPVSEATVRIIDGLDTLVDNTDYRGKFNISGIGSAAIELQIAAMGFLPFNKSYIFQARQRNVSVNVSLQPDANTLDEVVIKANVNPIRIAKDTVEYNAAAYLVRETDRVEDLLRQLPGIVIDNEGKVQAMGKSMTKLRINGEDFFTNNVSEFISQLPADMIARVQVINDYGDEAGFTGVKTGESVKMLNLVTKPGRNKGNFGNTSINGGSNERYGLQTNANFWREKKQIGIKGNVNSTNNAAGVTRNIATGVNYRDKFSEQITGSLGYSFDNVKNQSNQLDFIETVNTIGTIFTTDSTERQSNSNRHNLNWNLQSIADKSYFQAGVNASFADLNNTYLGNSQQRGVIRRDQINNNISEEHTPELNVNAAWAHRLNKPGRNLSVGVAAKNGISDLEEDLRSRVGYYGVNRPEIVKDSVLNRIVDTRNKMRNLSGSFRISEPFGDNSDSTASRNLDFHYTVQYEENHNNLLTTVNNQRHLNVVDSLSTVYTSKFFSHLFGLSYRFGSEDLSYSLGITGQPNVLLVENEQPRSSMRRTGFNITPVVNVSMLVSPTASLSLIYNGSSVAPSLLQLQPVPNTRNLQNIIIGNPTLKSTFNHAASFSYQNNNPKTGRALMFGVNSSLIQDQVVSNIILKRDTLSSLKQETRFENANGTFGVDALYSWSKPFFENRYNVEVKGSVGVANNVSFTDNIQNNNRGFNFSQSVILRMTHRDFTLSTDANYSYSSNRYSIALANLKNVQIYELNMNAKTYLSPRFAVMLDASKRIYQGYSLFAEDPFLINLSFQKSFLKKEQAIIKVQGYDLLNQGNYLMRSFSDNSIIDSRNNQITRYFQVSFILNLQQFGG